MNKRDILPFHVFYHHGNSYVINIENMMPYAVDETTAKALEETANKPEALIPPSLEESLKSLGLIYEDQYKRKTPANCESFAITNMALLLTQSCNLRCIYCYGDGGEYGFGGSMDEKTALQSVDWLIEQSGKVKKINIIFFGGEPFLNFSLMKTVVQYAEQRTAVLDKKVGFSVTTNATLLDDDKMSFIKEHNIHITVSIDGPKEIQDIQRPYAGGRGSYDTVYPKIKKLLEAMPDTRAHAVLADDTKATIVKSTLQEMGFTEVSLAPVSASLFDEKSGKAKNSRKLDGLFNEIETEADTWLRHIRNRDSQALKNLITSAQLYEGILSFLHNTKRLHACGAGIKFVGVSCSGDIYLCHRFVGIENYKLGNVFTGNIDREKYQKSPITWIEECADCFAKYYCAGGCKHDNASSCSSIFKPSQDMCNLRRREVELAAVVISNLDDKDRAFLGEHDIFPPKTCPLDF